MNLKSFWKMPAKLHKLLLKDFLIYLIVFLFFVGLSFSESILSIASVGLALYALFYGRYKTLLEEKSVWMLAGVFLVYLIGFIFTKDVSTGVWELQRNVFWVILPAGIAMLVKAEEKKIWWLLCIFVCVVTISSFVSSLRIIFLDYERTDQFRDASFVSHVALSTQVVFSMFILLVSKVLKTPVLGRINLWIVALWCLWLFLFLGFQKSLNAYLALLFAGFVFLIWYIRVRNYGRIAYLFIALFVLVPTLYVGSIVYTYFDYKEEVPDIQGKTMAGNPYSFDLNRFETENGYRVHWYINNNELKKEWNKISNIKIDERGASGYTIYSTLIRYMTSKGLRKDSAGVAALTAEDIQNVENGIANVVFVEKKYSLYPRIYQTIWELERYFKTGNANDQSLSQRFEFARAALYIIRHNIFGVGTGNFRMAFDDAFVQIDTKINPELWNNVHNQYLNYVVKFGVVGFLLIMVLIFVPVLEKKQFNNILSVLLLVIIGVVCMGETTLETHVGQNLFLFFLSVFMWHSPKLLAESCCADSLTDV